ncbi:hypothetical protein SMMN14_04732 [Sphaerulina musiva]
MILYAQVRPITTQDTGLRVLVDGKDDEGNEALIDIIAIHGIGAHPSDAWTKKIIIGSSSSIPEHHHSDQPPEEKEKEKEKEEEKWINWLSDNKMLPQTLPRARILQYGYQSAWFGQEAIQTRTTNIAERFGIAVGRERKKCPKRPLIIIAQCFGGLVVLKAILKANESFGRNDHNNNSGGNLLSSLAGILFFGTPFRGARGMSQVELLAAAREEYTDSEIYPEILQVLQPGNEYLQDLVDQFTRLRSTLPELRDCRIACFFELKASNVGRIVGGRERRDRMEFVVDESSGCLDRSEGTEKYSRDCSHFDMNKFGDANEEDYLTVADVLMDFARRN